MLSLCLKGVRVKSLIKGATGTGYGYGVEYCNNEGEELV